MGAAGEPHEDHGCRTLVHKIQVQILFLVHQDVADGRTGAALARPTHTHTHTHRIIQSVAVSVNKRRMNGRSGNCF